MATTCGIHIDGRRYHLVALDGTTRKHKILAAVSGDIPLDEDPVEAVAQGLRNAIKEHKLRPAEVQLAVDSGLAAFRTLTLPFDDRAKIEEVIKFEVENDLPQWDIDEVLVDFIVLSSKPGVESTLLVTALPKDRMEMQLAACEAGGLEAQEAELDGTALFDAASESGCLAEDAAQILVHVGDTSTTVVLADGGKLNSIRAFRAGAHPGALGAGAESEDSGAGDVEAGEDPGSAEAGERTMEETLEAERRQRQTVQRIRRELGRTLSAARTEHDIEAIYVCGHELPGLVHEEIFDTPIAPLEVLAEEGIEKPSEAVVAYGAALHALGAGTLTPNLRREELRFTGKFERLELPLAVFALSLFTLLTVLLIITNLQLQWRDVGTPDSEGDMQIWLMASNKYVFPDPDDPRPNTRLTDPPEKLVGYARRAEAGEIPNKTKYDQIREISRLLKIEIHDLKKELGQVSDIEQPQSALEATTLVMGVIRKLQMESKMRFGIRRYKAEYQSGSGRKEDSVRIQLEMDFFADSTGAATRDYSAMQKAIDDEPWCVDFDSKGTTPHDDGKGIAADRITIVVNLENAEEGIAQAAGSEQEEQG